MFATRAQAMSNIAALQLITIQQGEECTQKRGNGFSPGLNLARTSHGEGHGTKIPFVLSSGPLRES